MTDRPRVVGADDLEQLRRHRAYRDGLALQMGASVYALLRSLRELEARIDASVADEAAVMGQILQRHGVPAGVDASIDHGTGEIVVAATPAGKGEL